MKSSEFPNAAFICYLGSYGPGGKGNSNEALFDENVSKEAKKANVSPFELESGDLRQFIAYLKDDKPSNILITGVAGDGKTYLCRHAWSELGGDEKVWNSDRRVSLDIQTDSGQNRKIIFVKDLTDGIADTDYEDPSHILNLLIDTQADPSVTFVIACNHGQILKKLRESKRASLLEFAEQLNRRFFEPQAYIPETIKLIDLKRSRQDDMFKKVIELICGHEKWSECARCAKNMQCCIRKNCNMLYEDGTFTKLTNRMAQLFRLLEFDGVHFPIREQLFFVVNAILGKRHLKGVTEKMNVSCKEICSDNEDIGQRVNLFDNLFGWNLTTIKQDLDIYRQLSRFEIGSASNRALDAILLEGIDTSIALEPNNDQLQLSDEFIRARRLYLGDEPVDNEGISLFQEELKRARCRLFFSWDPKAFLKPEEARKPQYTYWALTALPHAQKYLTNVVEELEKRSDPIPVDAVLFNGLCHVMTGQKKGNSDDLCVTTRGTDVTAKSGMCVVARFPKNRKSLCIQKEAETSSLPILKVNQSSMLKLRPWLYEAILQFAEGYTVSSFSSQILSDLMSFKARLICQYQEEVETDFDSESEIRINLYPTGSIVIQLDNEDDEIY